MGDKNSSKNMNSDKTLAERRNHMHGILDDTLIVKLASVNNAQRTRKEAVDQRVKIVQDITRVSLTVLGGAITLQVFAHNTVKTHILFYLAVAGLLICVIASLVIRVVIAKSWDTTLNSLSAMEESFRMVVGSMKYHSDERHAQAYDDFEEALETDPTDIPDLAWPASMTSIIVLGSVFVISLISISLSLLFKISIN